MPNIEYQLKFEMNFFKTKITKLVSAIRSDLHTLTALFG